jgi:hypothetical protein
MKLSSDTHYEDTAACYVHPSESARTSIPKVEMALNGKAQPNQYKW